MKPYLIALEPPTRYARPAVGEFRYCPVNRRLVWRLESTRSVDRLAELMNEALAQIASMPFVSLRAVVLEDAREEIPTGQPDPTDPTDLGELTPGERRRRMRQARLLQHQPA